ncbi:MAG: putative capsid protein [Circoviridae sp.]|nr:MAG: putative capsid protein [Circoviridae sp.]AXQ65953.1 MAG: putative capsid protein [Circoviridae sp.]
MLRKRVYPFSKKRAYKYSKPSPAIISKSYYRPTYIKTQRIHIETKSNDQPFNFSPTSTGVSGNLTGEFKLGESVLIHQLERNNGSYGRVGNRVTLKNLFVNGQVQFNTNGGEAQKSPSLRVIFFIDKKPGDNPPSSSELLDLTGGPKNLTAVPDFYAYRNLPNVDRFRIIMDKRLSWNPSSLSQGTSNLLVPPKDLSFKIANNLKDYQAMYKEDDLLGTYDKMTQGAICMMVLSDVETLSFDTINVKGNSRLRYTDI